MPAMRLALAFPAILGLAFVMAGCPTFEGPPASYGPNGEDCHQNNPPALGNVELNSFYVTDWETWMFSIHFDWVDPGVSGAEDAPNMLRGRFTAEVFNAVAQDVDLTRDILESACSWGPVEEGELNPCVLSGHSSTGCADATVGCSQGELTVPYLPDYILQEDDEILLEFRVRDACDATSNEKTATYTIGSGLAVEGGGGDDDDGS